MQGIHACAARSKHPLDLVVLPLDQCDPYERGEHHPLRIFRIGLCLEDLEACRQAQVAVRQADPARKVGFC